MRMENNIAEEGCSGVAAGATGGIRPEAQQHTFCSHFKRVFRQKFRPKYA